MEQGDWRCMDGLGGSGTRRRAPRHPSPWTALNARHALDLHLKTTLRNQALPPKEEPWVGMPVDQHLPVALCHWGLQCQPGCPPCSSLSGCTWLMPGHSDWCSTGVHGGSRFVHWELVGSLPPISHRLFLLSSAWALRGSWGDKGPVHTRTLQHSIGMMPAGPLRPRGTTITWGTAATRRRP